MTATEGAPPGNRTLLALVLLGAICFAFQPRLAASVESPHNSSEPAYCVSCHTDEIYTQNCDEIEGFCLLDDSVDAICLICHVKEECCRAGQEHQSQLFLGERSHPSDIDISQVSSAHLPKTLPIHDGRITCRTCHLHTRPEAGDYKMLRLVEQTGGGVDWSVLCGDCHDK